MNQPTTRYFYDGQMCVEDDFTSDFGEGTSVIAMRYGIGARGIDFMAKSTDGGAETKGFPLYDGHGNMIATLGRSENSPYFGVADLRSYDVWGAVRSGSTTGDPKQRYCVNLGHVQDDESGLIYMRARYYEPWSGRFISEDPARDGWNWFLYCGNDSISRVDASGQAWHALWGVLTALAFAAMYELGNWLMKRTYEALMNGLVAAGYNSKEGYEVLDFYNSVYGRLVSAVVEAGLVYALTALGVGTSVTSCIGRVALGGTAGFLLGMYGGMLEVLIAAMFNN